MTAHTEPSDIVSVRAHIEALLGAERQLAAQRWEAHREAHDLLQHAINLAREQVNTKLAEMNEMRRQIGEERGVYATRVLLESAVDRLQIQVNSTAQSVSTIRTQLSLLAALVAFGVPVLMWLWK